MYIYIYIYIYIYVHTKKHIYTCTYICMQQPVAGEREYTYPYLYIHTYIYTYKYANLHMCIYIYAATWGWRARMRGSRLLTMLPIYIKSAPSRSRDPWRVSTCANADSRRAITRGSSDVLSNLRPARYQSRLCIFVYLNTDYTSLLQKSLIKENIFCKRDL